MMYYDPNQMGHPEFTHESETLDGMDVVAVLKRAILDFEKLSEDYRNQAIMIHEQRRVISRVTQDINKLAENYVKLRKKYDVLAGPSKYAFDTLLSTFDLPVRVRNIFKDMGLETVGDVYVLSQKELMRQPNFGKTSLAHVIELMEMVGLHDWAQQNK